MACTIVRYMMELQLGSNLPQKIDMKSECHRFPHVETVLCVCDRCDEQLKVRAVFARCSVKRMNGIFCWWEQLRIV